MKEALTFDDVVILDRFSDVVSRADVSLSVDFRHFGVSLPIVSSNMDTITGSTMAKAMMSGGAQACLHRFCSIEENVQMLLDSWYDVEGNGEYFNRPMVSIGLGKKELDRAYALYANNATLFIIDVAHGGQQAVVEQAKLLKGILKENGSVIVGNFANPNTVKEFLERTGSIVDGIKVGIGPGSVCSTRIKTGIGYPQLTAIIEISNLLQNTGITIVADGGMKTSGDIVKALGAGADLCMLGSMLAGTYETPGDTVQQDGEPCKSVDFGTITKVFKKYRGSASKESYEIQGKNASHRTAEGESFYVPYKGPVKDVLQDIEGGLRSAMSYVGARTLADFQARVEFVRVTSAGYVEGTPHGKKQW